MLLVAAGFGGGDDDDNVGGGVGVAVVAAETAGGGRKTRGGAWYNGSSRSGGGGRVVAGGGRKIWERKRVYYEEPKKVIHVLKDPSWIEAMQEELIQFKLQEVWTLVDLLNGKRVIGTKWVFRNKKDERGIVIRNKARIEAIRLFLAYASFKDFVVYQMDVKSAFLYGKIEEEVYVCQLLRFEDPDFPDRVYKVEKALYGLHQAPKAWHKGDILLVQVYVDDIIFGSTKKELCFAFEKLMHEKYQMSSMGELTFFLGLQVK
ncbi:putative ribonuclease H-like domain-containing protein [Tanacetum coccineum]